MIRPRVVPSLSSALLLTASLALAALLPLACTAPSAPPGAPGVAPSTATDDDIGALYAVHCAVCHGSAGGGHGPAAVHLVPPPRDFGEGRFHVVSTDNGVPSDADLARAIARGSPGTGMPAFSWLGTERVQALAQHIRELAIARMTERLIARWAEVGQQIEPARAAEIAVFRMTPGEPVAVPPPVEASAAAVARGREVWLERCAACHGVDGRGRTPDARWVAWDVAFARDLREGLLKGGARHEDLARRIVAGMPGSAMPPEHFADPADLQALLAFVGTLLPADAGFRGVTTPLELRRSRVSALPDESDGPDELRERIPLTGSSPDGPLWFAPVARRPGSVLSAEVGAVAIAVERIAIRVRWPDPTADARALDARGESDAVALQFFADPQRPIVGMGAPDAVSDIWHWAAFRRRETLGVVDLLEASHGLSGAYVEAEGLSRPLRRADIVHAPGAGPVASVAPRAAIPRVDGHATLGIAIWNGAAEQRGAIKSLSGWVRMTVEQ